MGTAVHSCRSRLRWACALICLCACLISYSTFDVNVIAVWKDWPPGCFDTGDSSRQPMNWSELGTRFYITVLLKCVHVNGNIAPKTRNGCESLLTMWGAEGLWKAAGLRNKSPLWYFSLCGVVGRFVKSRLCHQCSCLRNKRTVRSSCSQVWRTLSLVCRDYPQSWQQMPSLWRIGKTQPRWYNPTPDAPQSVA